MQIKRSAISAAILACLSDDVGETEDGSTGNSDIHQQFYETERSLRLRQRDVLSYLQGFADSEARRRIRTVLDCPGITWNTSRKKGVCGNKLCPSCFARGLFKTASRLFSVSPRKRTGKALVGVRVATPLDGPRAAVHSQVFQADRVCADIQNVAVSLDPGTPRVKLPGWYREPGHTPHVVSDLLFAVPEDLADLTCEQVALSLEKFDLRPEVRVAPYTRKGLSSLYVAMYGFGPALLDYGMENPSLFTYMLTHSGLTRNTFRT